MVVLRKESNLETITLGKLIELLENRPKDETVQFDFSGFYPSGVASYRGYYDQLALGFDPESGDRNCTPQITVEQLIVKLKEADGKTYTGYKGGEYRMNLNTPIWMANYGCATSTAIIGLADCDYMTIIATAFAE